MLKRVPEFMPSLYYHQAQFSRPCSFPEQGVRIVQAPIQLSLQRLYPVSD
jgi:hypothetical protein